MRFAFVLRPGAIEPEKRLLKEIVGDMRVSGETDEISPYLPRSPFVECAEALFIHPRRRGFRLRLLGRQRCLEHQCRNRHRSDHVTIRWVWLGSRSTARIAVTARRR